MKKLSLTFALLFAALSAMAGTVNLAWDPAPASDMITKYVVYWKPPGATTFTKLSDVVGSTTFATVNLASGIYSFFVTGVNAAGESPGSNIVTTPGAPPAQITGLKIVVP